MVIGMRHRYRPEKDNYGPRPRVTFLGWLVLAVFAGYVLPMLILFGGLVVLWIGDSLGLW